MQPQLKLINRDVNGLVNACEENVEFKLPKLTWVRFLNEGIMDIYDLLFIEATAVLTRPVGQTYFELPEDIKQIYMVSSSEREYQNWDIASNKEYDYNFANAAPDGTYSVFEGKLYIKGYSGTTVDLKYYRKPKFLEAINSKDEVDIPNEYIEVIILYACKKAMQAEDETDRYNIFNSEYSNKRKKLYEYTHRYRPERQLYWKVRR